MIRFGGLFSGAFLISLFLVAWEAFAPVTMFMKSENATRYNGTFEADVWGFKVKNCTVVRGSVIGWYRENGVWVDGANFVFLEDTTPDSSHPVGRNSLGRWQWSKLPPDADAVRITLNHNCLFGIRVTTVGGWRI